MKRREFLALLAGSIALRPNALLAQQSGRIFKIGHLESSTPSNSPHLLGALGIGFVNWAMNIFSKVADLPVPGLNQAYWKVSSH
jgi:hypothetical protein